MPVIVEGKDRYSVVARFLDATVKTLTVRLDCLEAPEFWAAIKIDRSVLASGNDNAVHLKTSGRVEWVTFILDRVNLSLEGTVKAPNTIGPALLLPRSKTESWVTINIPSGPGIGGGVVTFRLDHLDRWMNDGVDSANRSESDEDV